MKEILSTVSGVPDVPADTGGGAAIMTVVILMMINALLSRVSVLCRGLC